MSMDPKIKAAWVADLRNPENKQTDGVLKRKNEWDDNFSYCCLGRLYEVCRNEFGMDIDVSEVDESDYYNYSYDGGDSDYELPDDDFMRAIGIPVREPYVLDEDGNLVSLVTMNDNGHSFTEIADLIEKSDL